MNQSQLKYARERVTAIKNDKLNKIRTKHTVAAKTLDTEGKLKALQSGAFTVETNSLKSNNSYYWYNYVKFNDEIYSSFNQKEYDKERSEVEAKYTKLMDELVLGSNEEALKLIQEFENE